MATKEHPCTHQDDGSAHYYVHDVKNYQRLEKWAATSWVRHNHCADCGNPDCPNMLGKDGTWSRCPATQRLERSK